MEVPVLWYNKFSSCLQTSHVGVPIQVLVLLSANDLRELEKMSKLLGSRQPCEKQDGAHSGPTRDTVAIWERTNSWKILILSLSLSPPSHHTLFK